MAAYDTQAIRYLNNVRHAPNAAGAQISIGIAHALATLYLAESIRKVAHAIEEKRG